MKFQLSPLVLLSAATSVLASEDLAVSRSTQTVNNHDDLDRLQPKMNGKPVVPGESSPFFRRKHPRFSETVKSKVAFFMGKCSSDAPFEFFIGGASGRGAIGIPTEFIEGASLKILLGSAEAGKIVAMKDKAGQDFFMESDLSQEEAPYGGFPFAYNGRTSEDLSTVELSCSNPNPINVIVIVSDDEHEFAKAKVSHRRTGDSIEVNLMDETKRHSKSNLQAVPLESMNRLGRHLEVLEEGKPESITLKKRQTKDIATNEESTGCSMIQMVLSDSSGLDVPKTLVVCDDQSSSQRRRRLLSKNQVELENAEVDENGDVSFEFASLHTGNDANPNEVVVKFDARIGISSECKDEMIEVVDMDAMLLPFKPTLVVNGGWFRRAREIHGLNDCQWEPVVIDAIASDPEARYSYVAHMDSPVEAKVMTGVSSHGANRKLSIDELNNRRKLLTARASAEEMNITEEMTMGRKPEGFRTPIHGRKLSSTNKKILVHGYCPKTTGNPFPIGSFNNAIAFSDPDPVKNWSIDQFARKIKEFANRNSIEGCGIIAHSQGGMAALHLYKSYWSCLDRSSKGRDRLIQSVGTPYQGTNLAGSLAVIAKVFGRGKLLSLHD